MKLQVTIVLVSAYPTSIRKFNILCQLLLTGIQIQYCCGTLKKLLLDKSWTCTSQRTSILRALVIYMHAMNASMSVVLVHVNDMMPFRVLWSSRSQCSQSGLDHNVFLSHGQPLIVFCVPRKMANQTSATEITKTENVSGKKHNNNNI